MAESEEELKSLLMRVKEESERTSLKLNIEKTKIMTSDPITAWQIEGEKVEVSSDGFPVLGLQNHSRRWLHPWNQKTFASWQESYDKPRQCVEKQTLLSNKGSYSQGYGLPSDHI